MTSKTRPKSPPSVERPISKADRSWRKKLSEWFQRNTGPFPPGQPLTDGLCYGHLARQLGFTEGVTWAIMEACKLQDKQACKFFLDFAKGLACQQREHEETENLIRNALFEHADEIETLGSIREVAEFILEKLPMETKTPFDQNPEYRSSFHRRVQKICQRLGLKLRSRGRPRKK
jgi:hypothetical protein